jgi:hypothetical protein
VTFICFVPAPHGLAMSCKPTTHDLPKPCHAKNPDQTAHGLPMPCSPFWHGLPKPFQIPELPVLTRFRVSNPISCSLILTELQYDRAHRYLRFATPEERGCIPRLETAADKRLEAQRTICWETLDTLGQKERTELLLPPPWMRMFAISRRQFNEMTLEFYATFQFESARRMTDTTAIRFRLGGIWRSCSVAQFGMYAGFYTADELTSPLFTESISDFVNTHDDAEFWSQIGVGVWNPRTTKSTQIRDPLHRYIHRCLSHSIAGRHETGTVGRADLFLLYCIVTGARCNLAYCLAEFFCKAKHARQSSFLVGGSFISTIARSLRVKKRHCTEGPQVRFVDMTVCRRIALVTTVPPIPFH